MPMVNQLSTRPGIATAESGLVILDGPDGIAATMTPEAAEQTGLSLLQAAKDAQNQSKT